MARNRARSCKVGSTARCTCLGAHNRDVSYRSLCGIDACTEDTDPRHDMADHIPDCTLCRSRRRLTRKEDVVAARCQPVRVRRRSGCIHGHNPKVPCSAHCRSLPCRRSRILPTDVHICQTRHDHVHCSTAAVSAGRFDRVPPGGTSALT